MKLTDIAVLGIGAVIIFAKLGGASTSDAVTNAVLPGEVIHMTDRPLPDSQEAREAYAEFSQGLSFYGAMAITSDGRTGLTYEYNSLEAAKVEAVDYCAMVNNAPCELFAILVPSGSYDGLPEPLSAPAIQTFRDYQTMRGHRAFAVSDNGAYGVAWRWDTERNAREEALRQCLVYAVDDTASDPSYTQCRVIDQSAK